MTWIGTIIIVSHPVAVSGVRHFIDALLAWAAPGDTGIDIQCFNSRMQGRVVTLDLLCYIHVLEGDPVLAFIDGVGAVLDIWIVVQPVRPRWSLFMGGSPMPLMLTQQQKVPLCHRFQNPLL